MSSPFRTQLEDLQRRLAPEVCAEHIAASATVELPGHEPPWRATGIRVQRGQSYSLFAQGRIQWSAAHPARFGGPKFHLWARVAAGGRIVNLTQNSGSFIADVSGEIELGIYMGMWKDRFGTLATSPHLYQSLSGELECWAVAWKTSPSAGLAAIARTQPDHWFITNERARLAHPSFTPDGWSYLLETGEAEIFSARTELGRPVIHLDAEDDQGIITTPVDIALRPDTSLSWRWRAEALPSDLAENTPHTHDYFSIGTEFDNGRDLTWIWSAALQPGVHFHCPIKAWAPRETHFVVRTGTAALGEWHAEQRQIYPDVEGSMGPPPGKIVRVWLIAVTSFQHGRVRATFSDIVLQNADQTVIVL